LSQVLHPIEKQIIKSLKETKSSTPEKLAESTKLSIDQVRRGMEWLKLKGLADVKESDEFFYKLGKNGLDALENGLPERQCIPPFHNEQSISVTQLQKELTSNFGNCIGYAKQRGWIISDGNTFRLASTHPEPELPDEKLINFLGKQKISLKEIEKNLGKDTSDITLKSLNERPEYIIESKITRKIISLSDKAKEIDIDSSSDAIDVEADVRKIFVARTHPLKDTINEIREIFVTLGFSEILGDLSQSSFWNFDALFTPQDHPARELQDTFYIDGFFSKKIATPKQIQQVSKTHKKGWRYLWDINEARKMVLRTHTTCVTIKYLADNKPDEARVFSLGRVFRNEKVSYKHLVEFNQIEGIIVGKDTTLRDLMGIQREFYKRIGLDKVKFWPTFFPYTEPSLQSMVYNERLGKWVELFGMGIFRPEVTKPLGITKPVLAWGGGIERIAMLKYGVNDVREFYNNDLKWLRSVTKCQ